MTNRWDAIIIGAGAAGLWAAGTAAGRGRRVLLLEKNTKAGPKILMSGGTRCNLTHACSSRGIAEAFGKQGRSLLSVLDRLSPQDVVEYFARMGVATKTEETGKVFPASDRAIDVRDALVTRLKDHGAELRTGCAVECLSRAPDAVGFDVRAGGESLWAEHILITTGGLSYSGCGTTGDGYPWAQSFGHTITPLRPALTPLLSSTDWVHSLSGLTLDDVTITAMIGNSNKGKGKLERIQSRGGFLWTHFGFSGPTAMNVSRCFTEYWNGEAPQKANGSSVEWKSEPTTIAMDLVPDRSRDECQFLWNEARREGARGLATILSQWIPRRLADELLRQIQVPGELKMAEVSNRAVAQIVERLKDWRIPIHGTRGYPKAEVTAGGVALGEVNFQSMESKKTPGLFLAGEILDLDGPIGGYNFQAAWSTGHTAGLHL